MANITNFKPGETLTAEALNQAFDLVGARADAVIGLAQGAKDDAAEALAKVEQSTERIPELIVKVEEIEEVIPNLATTASVTAAQAAAQSYADTVGVNTATTAKAYTDSQVETIGTQIETLSSELTAQSADIDEVTGVLSSKADATAVYTKDETYTKSQVDTLYDVIPYLSSGEVIARIKTPAGTKPLYAPQGSSGGSSVAVNAIVTTGTHIADLTVDGVVYELYAPEGGTGGVTIDEVIAEIDEHLAAYSTTAQVTASLELKADKDNTYTKAEAYTKSEIDTLIPPNVGAAVHYSTKECDVDVIDNSSQYTFQYHDGVWTPNNHKIASSTAVIKLLLSNFRGTAVPVKVYTDSEAKYDKCIITYGGSDIQLCSASGEQQHFEYELPVAGLKSSEVTIKYQKDASGDKGIDSCAVKIGTDTISTGSGESTDPLPVHYYIADIPETYDEAYPTVYFLPSMMTPPATVSTGLHVLDVYAITHTDNPVKYMSAIWNGWNKRYEIQFPEYAKGGKVFVTLRSVSADTNQYFFYNEGDHAREKYIAITGIPDTASSDITATCAFTSTTDRHYEVTVIFDDPNLKFKDIVYADNTFTVTLPKECAGHSGYVHVKEVVA